jgi:hypothetical protein
MVVSNKADSPDYAQRTNVYVHVLVVQVCFMRFSSKALQAS